MHGMVEKIMYTDRKSAAGMLIESRNVREYVIMYPRQALLHLKAVTTESSRSSTSELVRSSWLRPLMVMRALPLHIIPIVMPSMMRGVSSRLWNLIRGDMIRLSDLRLASAKICFSFEIEIL